MPIKTRYVSKNDCQQYRQDIAEPNRRYSQLSKSLFTAGDEEQFESRKNYKNLHPKSIDLRHNLFYTVIPQVTWTKYRSINGKDVNQTFKYIFHKFKKGIYVCIRNNQLNKFIPFSNVRFTNTWHDHVQVDPKYSTMNDMVKSASVKLNLRPVPIKLPPKQWYANNSLVRFDGSESDNNIVVLYDMFKTVCSTREVPDMEFFINKRDYPILKDDGTEPYNHMYGSSSVKMHPSMVHDKYAPIFSMSSRTGYADLLIPTYEDWTRSVYQSDHQVMPNSCKEYPVIRHTPWEDKIEKAVFRGTNTGAGTTPDTNVRLKLVSVYGKSPLLDVGFTKWNLRPKKHESDAFFRIPEQKTYPTVPPLTMQEQSRYKYILHLEGNVAAFRMPYELSSGSLVLRVDSYWKTWYDDLLKPYVHYVPVKSDLSNLEDQIIWCRSHDDQCRNITQKALTLYNTYMNKEAIIDFLQKKLVNTASKTGTYNYLGMNPLTIHLRMEEEYLATLPMKPDGLELPYNLPDGPRCIGRLDGILTMFRNVPFRTFQLVNKLYENKNTIVHLVQRNNVHVVVKTAKHNVKEKEHIHEAYIGLKAINGLLADIPNVCYTYGTPVGHTEQIVSEFIQGTMMSEWIASADFNVKDYLGILIQLTLALSVAQQRIGFIHYDLYPWNVIISSRLAQKVTFSYRVSVKTNITVNTDLIPVMIDYGKSRAVVYHEPYGLIDSGYVNLYKPHALIDLATFMISTLTLIRSKNKVSVPVFDQLSSLLLPLGLSSDIDNYHGYGTLFNSLKENVADQLSSNLYIFVDHIEQVFPNMHTALLQKAKPDHPPFADAKRAVWPSTPRILMSRGNPIQTIALMKYGNMNDALIETIHHMQLSTLPKSRNRFFQDVIDYTLITRMRGLQEDVLNPNYHVSQKTLNMFNSISRNMMQKTIYEETIVPVIDVKLIPGISMHFNMTPEYIKTMAPHAVAITENIGSIHHMCFNVSESNALALNDPGLSAFLSVNMFKYLNAIASNNTLLMLLPYALTEKQ